MDRVAGIGLKLRRDLAGGPVPAERDRHRANTVEGSIVSFNTGVFASVDDLRAVALRTMSEAVDTLLDKPGFRAAVRR